MLYPVGTILYNPAGPTIDKVIAIAATNTSGRRNEFYVTEVQMPRNHCYDGRKMPALILLDGEFSEAFELRHVSRSRLVPVQDIQATHFSRGLSVLSWRGGYLVYDINYGYPSTREEPGEPSGAFVYGNGGVALEGHIENTFTDFLEVEAQEALEKETKAEMDVFGWLWYEIVDKPMEDALMEVYQ